ncbi:hypothetical protein ACOMHN_010599 [Nucella lapillus]
MQRLLVDHPLLCLSRVRSPLCLRHGADDGGVGSSPQPGCSCLLYTPVVIPVSQVHTTIALPVSRDEPTYNFLPEQRGVFQITPKTRKSSFTLLMTARHPTETTRHHPRQRLGVHPMRTEPDVPMRTEPDVPMRTEPDVPMRTEPDVPMRTEPDVHPMRAKPDVHPLRIKPVVHPMRRPSLVFQ